MIKLKYLVTVLLMMCCLPVYAVTVKLLYTDAVPVVSRSSKIRNHEMPNTLERVLIKVSGNENIANIPEILKALKHANNYVEEFWYTENQDNENIPLLLHVKFLKKSIDDLLRQSGQTIWSQDRPLILVWFAIKDQQGLRLLNSDMQENAAKILKYDAASHGLVLMFPMLDFSDLNRIGPTDVWAPFIHVIRSASHRYMPDDILVVCLDARNPSKMTGNFLLLSGDGQTSWVVDGDSVSNVVYVGVNNLIDTLTKQFTSTNKDAKTQIIGLKVFDLNDVSEYAKIMLYLQSLTGVSHVELADVSANQVQFSMTFSGELSSLKAAIRLNKILVPMLTDHSFDSQIQMLQYRYNGDS